MIRPYRVSPSNTDDISLNNNESIGLTQTMPKQNINIKIIQWPILIVLVSTIYNFDKRDWYCMVTSQSTLSEIRKEGISQSRNVRKILTVIVF